MRPAFSMYLIGTRFDRIAATLSAAALILCIGLLSTADTVIQDQWVVLLLWIGVCSSAVILAALVPGLFGVGRSRSSLAIRFVAACVVLVLTFVSSGIHQSVLYRPTASSSKLS